ncbi:MULTISPECIES: DUF6912 family protein [Gordonia]|uniref:Uncharacterized protein n=2 Tax=Gordonia TaxID=2053 RepID=L7LH43_9ACTN|nr:MULTISPECIES: hypothetical protein [Gordonia]AUH68229.1 hypothetical protein CXX93_07520 [Gordonia sp. YC-JH1]KJR08492.1 hypothetical protein UG54_07510 [Gordonia sihwensis]KXT58697.1 hypothetical protein Y710_00135 [Gordonia sp. QH-12]MBY4570182.1 hypothetical protein [Gordonia sihwensis]WFN92016.1 hypothetical protein P5P27_14725 [Gordonia sihwensis]
MRVYLPATLAMIERLVAEPGRAFEPVGGTGFALTPALREAYVAGDDEELSEVALREAARASLRLLAVDDSELPVRRVVVVADAEATPRPDLDDAVVRVAGTIPHGDIVAVHVDGSDAENAVRAAVEVIDRADLGDEDGELAVGDVEDHDLGWYATQELPFLLELL